jgi:transposase
MFGPWQTAASRFYRWRRAVVWAAVLRELQRAAQGGAGPGARPLAWRVLNQTAPALRRLWPPVRLGREPGPSSGPSGAGASARSTRHPRPPGPGRPRRRPERIVADWAYSTAAVRTHLRRRGIGAVIPPPSSQRPTALIDWAAYRSRNVVERLVSRLKQFRRVAIRYEKLAANYLAVVEIAAIRLMLKFENTA